MSAIGLTFAVLDTGGSAADLGYVFAASVVPQVLVMLGGGVLADRLGRRPVMLITDSARLAVQATLAAALFGGTSADLAIRPARMRCSGRARESSTQRSAASGQSWRRATSCPTPTRC